MKKALITVIAAVTAVFLATAVGAAALSPGLGVIAKDMDMTVNGLVGEKLEFSNEEFTKATGKETWKKLKIESLPEESAGVLKFGDVAVTKGQVIGKDSVSKLSFEPAEGAEKASFDFVFDGDYTMTCNVVLTSKLNRAPTSVGGAELTTFVNTACRGDMQSFDPDGDALRYEVVKYPEGGELVFDSGTGEFVYTAGSRVMNDSFTFKVKDSMGDYSKTAEVLVNVCENTAKTVFSDMDESTAVTAAAIMAEEGYMSCVADGGEEYFSPESKMTRLDFLVTAMNVFGADKIPKVENTGFTDDDSIPDKYKGYVYSAAKLGIISGIEDGDGARFEPQSSITRTEACVMLNNIIGYEATTVTDVAAAPRWAVADVCAMYELGISSDDGLTAALSKEDSADMLYKVSCLIGE